MGNTALHLHDHRGLDQLQRLRAIGRLQPGELLHHLVNRFVGLATLPLADTVLLETLQHRHLDGRVDLQAQSRSGLGVPVQHQLGVLLLGFRDAEALGGRLRCGCRRCSTITRGELGTQFLHLGLQRLASVIDFVEASARDAAAALVTACIV